MKKKQFISKLQFQKTTIVSFKAANAIVGRSMVNTDTDPISNNGMVCQTNIDCVTHDDQYSCVTCNSECCVSHTTRTDVSENCAKPNSAAQCFDSIVC